MYYLLFAGITEAGFITESTDYGSSGSPTWNLLLRRAHMREDLIFALIQMHGRRCARYGLSNLSCLFDHFTWLSRSLLSVLSLRRKWNLNAG